MKNLEAFFWSVRYASVHDFFSMKKIILKHHSIQQTLEQGMFTPLIVKFNLLIFQPIEQKIEKWLDGLFFTSIDN